MKSHSLFCLLALVAALFAGCTGYEPIAPVTTFVTMADDGRTVLIEEHGTLHFELETPDTENNHWQIQGKLSKYLKQIGEAQHRTYTDAMGSGNMTLFDFKTLDSGTCEVHFEYKNKKTGEVKKHYSITLDIKIKTDRFAN